MGAVIPFPGAVRQSLNGKTLVICDTPDGRFEIYMRPILTDRERAARTDHDDLAEATRSARLLCRLFPDLYRSVSDETAKPTPPAVRERF